MIEIPLRQQLNGFHAKRILVSPATIIFNYSVSRVAAKLFYLITRIDNANPL